MVVKHCQSAYWAQKTNRSQHEPIYAEIATRDIYRASWRDELPRCFLKPRFRKRARVILRWPLIW